MRFIRFIKVDEVDNTCARKRAILTFFEELYINLYKPL